MPANLDTTNTWLAILAVAVVTQTLLMLGAAIAAFLAIRLYDRVDRAARASVPVSAHLEGARRHRRRAGGNHARAPCR